MQVDPPPPQEVLKERRKPKFIVEGVTPPEHSRAFQWATEIIGKHERFCTLKVKDRTIVAKGDVQPEDIDIRSIYPFPDLHWIIYRNDTPAGTMWNLMLLSGKKMLFVSHFATI